MVILNDDNFLLFAVKHYDNPACRGMKDLETDLKRFKYIKRLLRRYERTKDISERLILNHVIVLNNLFGTAVVPMLFFRIEKKFWPQIKTFMVFLGLLPKYYLIQNSIPESEIPLDTHVIAKLRRI